MINNIENDKFYSPEEIAKKFQISLSSVYKLIKTEGLPHVRLGKIYRIPASDLNRYLAGKGKEILFKEEPQAPKMASIFVDLLKKSPMAGNVLEVWLFGSYARGDYDMDSDVDLLLVFSGRTIEDSKKVIELGEKAMEQVDYEELLSIKEVSEEEWVTMKKNKYLLAQIIEKEGLQLWKNP